MCRKRPEFLIKKESIFRETLCKLIECFTRYSLWYWEKVRVTPSLNIEKIVQFNLY